MTQTQGSQSLAERQIAFRLASVRVALGLTILAATAARLRARHLGSRNRKRSDHRRACAGDRPRRPRAAAAPHRRGPWREPFFVAWTVMLIVCIAGATAADEAPRAPIARSSCCP